MDAKHFFSAIAILFCFSAMAAASDPSVVANLSADPEYKCVYTVYVRTSKTINAGTDSIISVALYTASGDGILIKNLEAWGGVMENGHDYFERGNLDIFTGRGPCLDGPVCAMELTSDGSGEHHGWYCNYVEVTTTGPHIQCAQQLFTVEQWLALDRSPYKLTAEIDNCDKTTNYNSASLRRRSANLIPIDVVPHQVASS